METEQPRQTLPPQAFPFQLQDVRIFEISATIEEVTREEGAPLPLEVDLISDESPPDAEEFGLLLTFGTSISVGADRAYVIHIAIEGKFEAIVDTATVSVDLIDQFKSRDAIILLWPYLRQTLHDLTARMRLDIAPLPVLDARALVQKPVGEKQKDS